MALHLLMTKKGEEYVEHDGALSATTNMGHELACRPMVFPSKRAAKDYAAKRASENVGFSTLYPVPLKPTKH